MAVNADKLKGIIEKAAIGRLSRGRESASGHYLAPENPAGMLGNSGHHVGGPFAYGHQHGSSGRNTLKNAGT